MLAEAQRLGYAEADPTFDVDGFDAAHKISILAALAFGCAVDFRRGRRSRASRRSRCWTSASPRARLPHQAAGLAPADGAGSRARVHPCMVPLARRSPQVDGVLNAVVVEGDHVGRIMLEGRGAGAGPTAAAVVADLLDVARGAVRPVFGVPPRELRRSPGRADGTPCGALLPAPDGDGPARRDRRRRRRRCATRCLDRELCCSAAGAPGEAVPVVLTTHDTRGGARCAAARARSRPAGGARAAAPDPHRAALSGPRHPAGGH